MKIKWGAIVSEGRGKLGSTVASRNRFGNYFRAKTTPVNPNTPRQNAIRTYFSSLAQRFKSTLTSDQKSAWSQFGDNSPISNVLGDKYKPSGINSYLKPNALLLLAGEAVIDDPPVIFGDADAIISDVDYFTVTTVDQKINVASELGLANWDKSTDDDLVLIFLGQPKNPNVSFFNGPYRYAGKIVGNLAVPPVFPYSLAAPWEVVTGQRVWLKIVHINPTRNVSNATIKNLLVIA